MNIFFDVDYTVLGRDRSLRPFVHEVFELLIDQGHAIYIWSGAGDRTKDVQEHDLEHLVSGIYVKPLSDFDAGLLRYGIPLVPDFVIDDYPQIVDHFGGCLIAPYYDMRFPDDDLMAIPAMVATHVPRSPRHRTEPDDEPSVASVP